MEDKHLISLSPYILKSDAYSSHAKIARFVKGYATTMQAGTCCVLDVGCAAGFLRYFLPSPAFYLMGIEYNESLLRQAQQAYDEMYLVDLVTEPVFILKRQPDVIVFGDVLEHLPDPHATLASILRQHARPGTRIIVSLPNIAHLFVRLQLMLGKFDYADRGILDRTHLHFYTMKTARELVAQCNVRVEHIDVTPVPLPILHPWFRQGQWLYPVHQINAILTRLFKTLLGYQVILAGVYEP